MRYKTLNEWLSWQEGLHPKAIDLGLDRVRKVYQRINQTTPHPYTITIAGTNGKGSCIALLDSILREAGCRVGAYTSPHMLRYNERIRVAGEIASDEVICAEFDKIEQVRNGTSLSYFEFGTLAALGIFSNSNLDIQLLEVGLGGRLDAVNLLDADIALITSIAIDHTDWLGESRESIGLEKAGILRTGVPAVIGDPEPPQSLLDYARERDVPLACSKSDFDFKIDGDRWQWTGVGKQRHDLPRPALSGEHQFYNAAAVLQVIEFLPPRFPVSAAAIDEGLRNVSLTGRFQLFPGSPDILVDVAHNPQSAEALARYLRQNYTGRPTHAVFSIMGDKDIAGVVDAMSGVVDHWYISPLDMARAADSKQISAALQANQVARYSPEFSDFEEALGAAKKHCPEHGLVLIFGSFFLVARYLGLLEAH